MCTYKTRKDQERIKEFVTTLQECLARVTLEKRETCKAFCFCFIIFLIMICIVCFLAGVEMKLSHDDGGL